MGIFNRKKVESKPAEFYADPDGNNINAIANMAIIEKVLKDNKEVEREKHRQHFGKDCGCSSCRQRVTDLKNETQDLSDWATGSGRWDPNKPEEPKKKRRR